MPNDNLPDAGLIRRLVISVVRRDWPMFWEYRTGIGFDDLVSIGVIRALEAGPKWDGARGAYSTFICTAVHWCFLDELDSVRARRVRERKIAEAAPRHSWHGAEGDACDIAGELLRDAERAVGGRVVSGRGRRSALQPSQQIAIVALRQRLNASARSMEWNLRNRPRLAAVLRISKPPNYVTISRLTKSVMQLGSRVNSGHPVASHAKKVDLPRKSYAIGRRECRIIEGMADVEGPMITVTEAAETLDVSEWTLKRWRKQRRHLAYIRDGTTVLYRAADVQLLRSKRRQRVEVAG